MKTLAGVLSFGLLVHGWDFAVATGHPIKVPDRWQITYRLWPKN